jgi:hypothetical protein
MEIKELDKALVALARKKNELSKLDYASETYDELEEELHDMEDDLVEEFGDFLEDALHDVHDEYCPDSDVLIPTAYLANKYIEQDGGFDVEFSEGVFVEMDDYPGKATKLVLLPSPPRIILQIDPTNRQVVWQAK